MNECSQRANKRACTLFGTGKWPSDQGYIVGIWTSILGFLWTALWWWKCPVSVSSNMVATCGPWVLAVGLVWLRNRIPNFVLIELIYKEPHVIRSYHVGQRSCGCNRNLSIMGELLTFKSLPVRFGPWAVTFQLLPRDSEEPLKNPNVWTSLPDRLI